jgi:hypothetical protein
MDKVELRLWRYEAVDRYLKAIYVWVGMVLSELTQRAKLVTCKWPNFRQCPVIV